MQSSSSLFPRAAPGWALGANHVGPFPVTSCLLTLPLARHLRDVTAAGRGWGADEEHPGSLSSSGYSAWRHRALTEARGTRGGRLGVTMGGDQSRERTERDEDKPEDTAKPDNSQSQSAASDDTSGELPQCRMGNRKVDNMCFMISCTNWY